MAEYLAALTAAVTALGGLIGLGAAFVNLFDLIGKPGEDGQTRPRRRIVFGAVGLFLILVGGIAFYQWQATRPLYRLAVEIQDKQSRPDRIIAKKVFSGVAGREVPPETLSEITGWIGTELDSQNYPLEAKPFDIEVMIPEDASVEPISVTPSDPRTTLSYGFVRGTIVDTLSATHLMPSQGRSFFLVVERPGYAPVWLRVLPGRQQSLKTTLEPAPIRIMVGGFTCSDTPRNQAEGELIDKLEAAMVEHSQVVLYSPEDYQAVAETLSNSPDSVARQEPWELDLLILGTYERL